MGVSTARTRALARGLVAIALTLGPAGSLVSADPVDTITVTSASYFESYAGAFMDVTARSGDHAGGCAGAACPTLDVSYSTDGTTFVNGPQTTMTPVVDAGVYLRHHLLIRLANEAGLPSVVQPVVVRVTSSHTGSDDRPVDDFVDNAPGYPAGFQSDFATRYQTPQDATTKVDQLHLEFPDLTSVIVSPFQTNGFRRHAQASMGCDVESAETGNSLLPGSPGARAASFATPSVCADGDATSQAARAVVLTSKAWGNDAGLDAGNLITARFTGPGNANQPLSVAVIGTEIHVSLATDASGALASTTSHVIDAINANPAAAGLVTATRYRNNPLASTAIVQPTPVVSLSDFLFAPQPGSPSDPPGYEVARAPFSTHVLRIGAVRDGSKVGVLLYAGLESDTWTGTLATLELAERLVRNYATDPTTRALLDELDIFIVPTANPDGMNFSMLNGSTLAGPHRKNMVETCGPASGPTDPGSRFSWGVNLDRNFSVASVFDGYAGASTTCSDDVNAGPFELSEPETRTVQFLAATFPNIKFAADVDSTGGFVVWPAGAYTPARVGVPAVSFGTDAYYRQTTKAMLSELKAYRGTVFDPDRIGPAIDTLPGSAAGNSVDELYYSRGILALQLRCGADTYSSTSTTSNTGTPVGPRPDFSTEARHQGQECANALYSLLGSARAYAIDTTAPVAQAVPGSTSSTDPIPVVFATDEPADLYYTTDGSTPTFASQRYAAAAPGDSAGQTLTFGADTTLKWIAVDIKGNTSAVQTAVYTIQPDTTPPVITPVVTGTLGTNGWYRSDVTVAWTVTDPESAITSPPCAGGSVTTDTASATFSCSATSQGGTATNTVAIKRDTTPPVIAAHGPVSSAAAGPGGAVVVYTPPSTTDNLSSPGTATCSPASGTTFPLGPTVVQCGAIDEAGNPATATQFTVTVLSARATIQSILIEIQGLGPVNRDTDRKVADAIQHLQRCVEPVNWTDPSHVAPGKSNKVFDECKAAVKSLLDIKNPTPGLATAIGGWIDGIVSSARALATTAIAEGGAASDLAKATDELGKGDADRATGKFERAIDHYKNAWRALKP